MAYQRILDFSQTLSQLESPELRALEKIWHDRKGELQNTGVYQEFIRRLQREWAIETGIIERLYTWDRGVTQVLIEQGVDASLIAHQSGLQRDKAQQITNLINDQLQIVEGLFAYIKGEEPLTEYFIRGLQAQFTAHQDTIEIMTPEGERQFVTLQKGQYKTLPNNPKRPSGETHTYCPPELVPEEMGNLVRWYREWEDKISPEVGAAWLHHRFTQIHPFQDGNGRVARALASLVFIKAGLFPLVIRDLDRPVYIHALEAADAQDLKPLITLFTQRQKESILRALGLEQQVIHSQKTDQIITAAVTLLKTQYEENQQQLHQVYTYADCLFQTVQDYLEPITITLQEQLTPLTLPDHSPYGARLNFADRQSDQKHYFHQQIIEIAQRFDYFANLDRYRAWVRLSIVTTETFELIFSFHGYGRQNYGIMAISAFTACRVPKEEGGTTVIQVQPACIDLFQLNYAESLESIQTRFQDWLESAVAIGLGEWQRRIASH
ncbi:MAG: Fic family protein [Prochlorothrix sp.]